MALYLHDTFRYTIVMNLKELRKHKGLTQLEASEIINIPLRTYKRYESEKSLVNSFKYTQIYNNLLKIPAKTGEIKTNQFEIAVVGLGYVGLSLATLLSIKNSVVAFDINEERISKVNARIPYFNDPELVKLYQNKALKLKAMLVNQEAFKNKDFVIIATNTDFNNETKQFDVSSVLSTYKLVREINSKCLIVIKSTVPIGFTKSLNDKNVIFSPEFLREGNAIYDNLHPSRIIIGTDYISQKVKNFAYCLKNIARENVDPIYMSSKEAEAVKLFSNAYLAMRVAYFNELDTYAETNDLDTANVIKGVSLDPRIGDYYNNPSFGYGGYCLPKDTAQLKGNFVNITNSNLIGAIVESNRTRKEYIAEQIINRVKNINNPIIGIYRLSMKKNSDNYRNASILDIIDILLNKGFTIKIFDNTYHGEYKEDSFDAFVNESDLIIANRLSKELEPFKNKVYSRDLTNRD